MAVHLCCGNLVIPATLTAIQETFPNPEPAAPEMTLVQRTFTRLPWREGYVLMVDHEIRLVTPFVDVAYAYLRTLLGRFNKIDGSTELWFGERHRNQRKIVLL